MPHIQKTKNPLRKPTTTKQKPGKAKGRAKQAPKAPRKALGASQSPSKPLPTPQAKAMPKGTPEPSSGSPSTDGNVLTLHHPMLKSLRHCGEKTVNHSKRVDTEPLKSELELLIETVNHKHMDTIRLGKAFVASALEVEAALDKASKRVAGVGWELRGVTAVSEVDKSVYRRVGLAKTERIANFVSPISRANLSEVLRVIQDLGLQIEED